MLLLVVDRVEVIAAIWSRKLFAGVVAAAAAEVAEVAFEVCTLRKMDWILLELPTLPLEECIILPEPKEPLRRRLGVATGDMNPLSCCITSGEAAGCSSGAMYSFSGLVKLAGSNGSLRARGVIFSSFTLTGTVGI